MKKSDGFKRGSGCFICDSCGKLTRHVVGLNDSTTVCPSAMRKVDWKMSIKMVSMKSLLRVVQCVKGGIR